MISESRETTFDYDVTAARRRSSRSWPTWSRSCATTLERQRRRGRTIGIKVRLDDFSTHTRARTLPDPVGTADRVGPVALELLRRFAPPRPVRLLGVRVAGCRPVEPSAQQLTLAV